MLEIKLKRWGFKKHSINGNRIGMISDLMAGICDYFSSSGFFHVIPD